MRGLPLQHCLQENRTIPVSNSLLSFISGLKLSCWKVLYLLVLLLCVAFTGLWFRNILRYTYVAVNRTETTDGALNNRTGGVIGE